MSASARGLITKSAAIRSVLRAAEKPLRFYPLWERFERKADCLTSRARLENLLAVMQTHGEIVTHGRGETRTFELARGV